MPTDLKDLQQEVKSKLNLIRITKKELKVLHQQIKELTEAKRSTVKAKKPYGRAKNYSFHKGAGKYHVHVRNAYLGYFSEYFETEKEAYDRVTQIYVNAGCTGSRYL
jgi:hypothetical protein